MNEESRSKTLHDSNDAGERSSRATGPGRLLIVIYAVFAVAATARATFQIATVFDEAPLAFVLSAVSGVIYICATISLSLRGLRAYWFSVVAVLVEFVGVISVGIYSLADPGAFPKASVWSGFGWGYGFFPLLLPILGMIWLYRKRPQMAADQH